MKQFKDLGIKAESQAFIGNKLNFNQVVGQLITIHAYRIEDSLYERGNGKCLWLQISINGIMHVTFSGSRILMGIIQKIEAWDFPFETTIKREGLSFQFT